MTKVIKQAIKLLFIFYSGLSLAQGTWTQKADFGGTERNSALGFSVGLKGYILTGIDEDSLRSDFWEYDPGTDTWTEKARFPGTARRGAVGFSIGDKGYVGTGRDSDSLRSDFWEYDPSADTWTQKASFGGSARSDAVGFSIGSKGYIGTGYSFEDGYGRDFWEYDPAIDTWTRKADAQGLNGGVGRHAATGFSIGNKGYITMGGESIYGPFWNDLLEWDQATDTWINKASFPGIAGDYGRHYAAGFAIGTKGYVGTGYKMCDLSCFIRYKDLWEWDQATNTWTQKADFAQTGRMQSVGFSIADKGYIGTGLNGDPKKDFWEYCPTCIGVGAPELSALSGISLYPNPAGTSLTVQVPANNNSCLIMIYNTTGQLVHQTCELQAGQLTINVSALTNGLYYLTLQGDESSVTGKFEVLR